MKRKLLRIDENGFFIEDVLIEESATISLGCIIELCPEGFYRPKWDGIAWVEGMSAEEIAAIPSPVDEDVELIKEIQAATTLEQLKDALTGKNGLAKVKANKK